MPQARELLDEGLRLEKAGVFDRALEHYSSALRLARDPATEAEAYRRQAHVRRLRCEWRQAIFAAQTSARIAQNNGLHDHFAEALNAEAAVYQSQGEFATARALYEQILHSPVNDRVRGVALQNLASVCGMQDDMDSAAMYFREAYDCFGRAGYAWGKAHVLNNLGRVAFEQKRFAEAEELLRDAIEEAKQVDDLDLVALARLNYAEVLLARDAFAEAEDAVSAAVGQFTITGNHWRRIECLRLLGALNARQGMPRVAERFFHAALRIAEEIGAKAERQQLLALLQERRTAGGS